MNRKSLRPGPACDVAARRSRLKVCARIGLLILVAHFSAGIAIAQSSTGEIYGQVSGSSGATVKATNKDTGVSRTLPINSKGTYSGSEMPTGEYHVVLEKDGEEISSQDVIVKPGVGTVANFDSESTKGDAVKLGTVTVRGASLNSIDTSTAQTSTNFSAKQLAQLAVAQDPVQVALLTPSASAGAPGFGNLASFGGSSVAENSYYINGFNVTNLFRNLSYAPLPFEAIANEQVLTGGYGPEYDLSTGGVINLTTKRGSNKWTAGVSGYWDPDSLRGSRPDIKQNNGQLRRNFDDWNYSETTTNGWVSGALIPNRLFFYGLASQTLHTDVEQGYGLASPNSALATSASRERMRAPFYLGKLDFNIDENNLIEYTHIENKRKYTTGSYSDSYGPDGHSVIVDSGQQSHTDSETGGKIDTVHFTSNITSDLTFSAQWGQLKYSRAATYYAGNGQPYVFNGNIADTNQPGCPFVSDNTDNGANNTNSGTDPNTATVSSTCSSGASLYPSGLGDFRTNWRGDLEYKIDLGWVGSHDFKIGYDHDNFKSKDGQTSEGGSSYAYYTVDDMNSSANQMNYVEQTIFATSATAQVFTSGYYFKDNWKFIDRWTAEIGVRADSFDNRNGVDQSYVKQDNILQPRLGLIWDVKGDSSMKAYAHYGIYSLPVTAGVAIRGASASIYSQQDFYYNGTDPVTGLPQNTTPTPVGVSSGGGHNFYSQPYFLNGENGNTPNPGSIAASNLDPIQQSEYILGFQAKFLEHWIGGVRLMHRNLDKTIDDSCDLRPVAAYAASHYPELGAIGDNTINSDGSVNAAPAAVPGCFIINPGSGADLLMPLNASDPSKLYPIHLSAADIGEPKAKRVYDEVGLTIEKELYNRWYFNGSYTWAHSYGNTEGLVRSDIVQTDTGTTVDFDFPEVMQGSYGKLSNDHRHTLKLFGSYEVLPEVTAGLNFIAHSGSPYGCLGVTRQNDPYGYGNSYHICNGKVVSEGSAGYTDFVTQFDLNVQYRPHFIKGLTASVAVFNIFDEHAVEQVYPFGESGSGSSYAATRYAIPLYSIDPYQTPRYFRFGLRYDLPF